MNKELRDLFHDYINDASQEDLDVLKGILQGMQKKQNHENNSYLGGIFQMEQTVTEGLCEMTIPLSPLLDNPLGILHGGITATLIDSAMGTLANMMLPKDQSAVTTQLNIHYLSVGKGDYIKCAARIDHKGAKTMVLSADVIRSDGKKIAQATGSFFIVSKK